MIISDEFLSKLLLIEHKKQDMILYHGLVYCFFSFFFSLLSLSLGPFFPILVPYKGVFEVTWWDTTLYTISHNIYQ